MLNVLTYDHPHRRTADLCMALAALGHDDVRVIILPWVERKNHTPLVWHRPPVTWHPPPVRLAMHLGYVWQKTTVDRLAPFIAEADETLIGGASILPPEVVEAGRIVNAHPSWLPSCRGMDPLKWSVYDGIPPAVTTYVLGVAGDVDDLVDTGWPIARRSVPIHPTDTFHAVAWKTYDLEVAMLVEAIGQEPTGAFVHPDDGSHHRRMKHADDVVMLRRFRRFVS